MSKQVIMRPCYNRPEMLMLSLEYEIAAREHTDMSEELTTLFVVEHGSPKVILDLIANYPYPKKIIQRSHKFGLSANILEGLKEAFSIADDWVMYIEDDILLHETYFTYINLLLKNPEFSNYSVLSPYNFDDKGDVGKVRKDRHYAALGPVISKDFFINYINPCATSDFYNNPAKFVVTLNNAFKDHFKDRVYRYKDATHHQQAGLINRLCDVARIQQDMSVVMPEVNRIQHIGIYGHNRRVGTPLAGKDFNERFINLKNIITDSALMYEMAGSKEYNDYKVFSPKLKLWDGTLTRSEKDFIS